MLFDRGAHSTLVGALRADADRLESELDRALRRRDRRTPPAARRSAPGSWTRCSATTTPRSASRASAPACGRAAGSAGGGARTATSRSRRASSRRWRVALEPDFPIVARYLRTHAEWTHAAKLLGTFGESLAQWVDDDGRLRGQLKVGGTVTLRHSASRPNVQQMPRAGRVPRAVQGAARARPDRGRLQPDRAPPRGDHRARRGAARGLPRGRATCTPRSPTAIGLPRGAQSQGRVASPWSTAPASPAWPRRAGSSLERAAEVVERFLGAYPGLRAYRERAPREAEALGYIPIRPGRRVLYDPVLSKGTQAINYAVQGGAASRPDARAAPGLRRARRPARARRAAGRRDPRRADPRGAGGRAAPAARPSSSSTRCGPRCSRSSPRRVAMGADRLAAAAICSSWAEKS